MTQQERMTQEERNEATQIINDVIPFLSDEQLKKLVVKLLERKI